MSKKDRLMTIIYIFYVNFDKNYIKYLNNDDFLFKRSINFQNQCLAYHPLQIVI